MAIGKRAKSRDGDLNKILKKAGQSPFKRAKKKTPARAKLDSEIAKAERDKFEKKLLSQITAERLPTPVREHIFHPVRKWRADFAWPVHGLIVEVDGGVYSGGRHTRGKGFEQDCIKKAEAILHGWSVMNFSTNQVTSGEAIGFIRRFFNERAAV